jgi:hypothetical protein
MAFVANGARRVAQSGGVGESEIRDFLPFIDARGIFARECGENARQVDVIPHVFISMPFSLFFHLNLSVAGCAGLWRICQRVPEGYEDEAGFHFGVEPAAWCARLCGSAGFDHQ